MGLGGVAIAALPTVICLKVPFSDGLGGQTTILTKMRSNTLLLENDYSKDRPTGSTS